jgi:hypothetical protein
MSSQDVSLEKVIRSPQSNLRQIVTKRDDPECWNKKNLLEKCETYSGCLHVEPSTPAPMIPLRDSGAHTYAMDRKGKLVALLCIISFMEYIFSEETCR